MPGENRKCTMLFQFSGHCESAIQVSDMTFLHVGETRDIKTEKKIETKIERERRWKYVNKKSRTQPAYYELFIVVDYCATTCLLHNPRLHTIVHTHSQMQVHRSLAVVYQRTLAFMQLYFLSPIRSIATAAKSCSSYTVHIKMFNLNIKNYHFF